MGLPLCVILLLFSKISTCIKWQLEPQPDNVDRGSYDVPKPDDGRICLRECVRGEIARICYYKFHLDEYAVLGSGCGDCPNSQPDCMKAGCITADGYRQTILAVNGRVPGPSIQVCVGDTVKVEVINNIPGMNVTLHWHGINHRGVPGTPWMDGVPYVTQCPVRQNQSFHYHFVPGEPGTFLWHSFDGEKQLQGLVGSLIVREPRPQDNLKSLYDLDLPSHVILVQDWVHRMVEDNAIESFLRYVSEQIGKSSSRNQVPDTFLVNGQGIDMSFQETKQMPMMEFYVQQGYRYRFRIIGGTSLTCPFRLTIQGHQLLLITADSNYIKPVSVDSLIVSSGERYDVVLNAVQSVCSYWILVEGVDNCESASQLALLRYRGCSLNQSIPLNTAPRIPKPMDRYTLNPVDGECSQVSLTQGICVSQLTSPKPIHLRLSRLPDLRFLLSLEPLTYSDEKIRTSPYSILLFTSEMPNTKTEINIPLNAVFEILIVNTRKLKMSSPCHIHGHEFYIVEQGKLPVPFLSDDLHNLQMRLADKKFVSRLMPSKDTIAVSDDGYVLIRILADNPGFWPLRCVSDQEMSVIIQVGRLSDIPSLPDDYPSCEGFQPFATDLLTM